MSGRAYCSRKLTIQQVTPSLQSGSTVGFQAREMEQEEEEEEEEEKTEPETEGYQTAIIYSGFQYLV